MQRLLKYLLTAALFIFLAIIPFIWLRRAGFMINGVDTNFPLSPITWFLGRFYVWNPLVNGGSDASSSTSAIYFHGLQAFFYHFGFSIINTEKMTLIFWLLLLGFSIYYLFKTIQEIYFDNSTSLRAYLARISTVIFYVFNLYEMDVWKNVKVANLMLLIAVPLALAVVMRLMYKNISFSLSILLLVTIIFICSGMGLNPAYFLLFVFTIFSWLLFYIVSQKVFLRKDRKQQLLYTIGVIGCIGVVSSFWLIPLLANMLGFTGEKVTSLQDLGAQQWLDGLSKNTSIFAVIRLLGAWDWYENGLGNIPYVAFAHTYFTNPFFIFYSLLIPLVAVMGFYFYRHKSIAFYFSFLMIIGLLFSTGTHPPFGFFYLFLTDHLPFFSFFRSPWYIFSYLTVLGYAVCIGFFVQKIVEKYHSLGITLIALLLIGNLIYSYPMLRGDIFRQNQTLGTYYDKFPTYVFDASKYLNWLSIDARILLTPQTTVENYQWGYSGVTPLVNLISDASVISPSFGQSDIGPLPNMAQNLQDELVRGYSDSIKKTVGIMGITHVINRKDLYDQKALPDNIFFSDVFDLSKTKHFGSWDVYTVDKKFTKPLFWIPTTKISVDGDVGAIPKLASFQYFPQDTEITVTSGTKTVYQRQLPIDQYKQSYIIPNCIYCEGYEHSDLSLPYVRFLPGSFFYKFVTWKEMKQEKSYSDPLLRSRFDLSLADKRLAEINAFIIRREPDNSLIENTISGFADNIQKAISAAQEATNTGEDTNTYWVDLLDHLSAYIVYIHTLEKKNDLPPGVFNDLDNESLHMELAKKNIQSNLWYSDPYQTKRFVFSVPENTTYTLFYRENKSLLSFYKTDPARNSVISIDGQTASESGQRESGQWIQRGDFFLKQGKHKIIVTLPQLTNMAHINKDSVLALRATDAIQIKTIPVDELLPTYTYHLTFKYRSINGLPPRFAINFSGINTLETLLSLQTRVLESSGEWETFSQKIQPDVISPNATLVFMAQADNTENGTNVEFKNIQLTIDKAPAIILYHQNNSTITSQKPSVSYHEINPTMYNINITNATSPYTLLFNQSYQKGWEASINGNKISAHYLENGYANAWDIDKKGNYQIAVVYKPQKLFSLGIIITVCIAIISLIVIIVSRIKKYGKSRKR